MKIHEIVSRLKNEINLIDARALSLAMDQFSLLDCREQEEVELGVIAGATWIPKGKVDLTVEKTLTDKTRPVAVYCASGTRSILVARTLLELGYTNVSSLDLGIEGWKNLGLPIVDRPVSKINRRRYKAQLALEEIGDVGQEKLGNAKVLLIGCGGLGSPTGMYLAAAGVGTIGLVDDDRIDESNLQRQILHSTRKLGMAKVESAFMTLKELNPSIHIVQHSVRATADNIDDLVAGYDIVIDGCDNFNTRYLVNAACLKHKKTNVHGSVFAFQGQVAVFGDPSGPCYNCLFPEPPTKDVAPNCAEGGVLGAVVGVIGSLVAVETVKRILGHRSEHVMQCYDGWHGSFDTLRIQKNPNCKACSIARDKITYQHDLNFDLCEVR